MALFVANFQVSIALGSFVAGPVVDPLGLSQAMVFGVLVAAVGFAVLGLTAAKQPSRA